MALTYSRRPVITLPPRALVESTYGHCQVLSRLPSAVVDKVLEKTELAGYFASQHRVTAEDEPYDDYRGYMLVSERFASKRTCSYLYVMYKCHAKLTPVSCYQRVTTHDHSLTSS